MDDGREVDGFIAMGLDPIPGIDDGLGVGQGLGLGVHPRFIRNEHPMFEEMLSRFTLGAFTEGEDCRLTDDQIDRMSSLEIEMFSVMRAVRRRFRQRQMKAASQQGAPQP